jgi:hypothetical protein
MATFFHTRRGETIADCRLVNGKLKAWDYAVTTAELHGGWRPVCTFCESPEVSAYWHTPAGDIAICSDCAVEVLPQLLADALVGERGDRPNIMGQLHRQLVTVLKKFWEAAAGAVSRSVRCRRTT